MAIPNVFDVIDWVALTIYRSLVLVLPHLFWPLVCLTCLSLVLLLRILTLFPGLRRRLRLPPLDGRDPSPSQTTSRRRSEDDKVKTALFLGSGGHTTELLLLLSHLDPQRYTPRIYLISSGDDFSRSKVEEVERTFASRRGSTKVGEDETQKEINDDAPPYEILSLARARRVHQPWSTTPFTTFLSLLSCLRSTAPQFDPTRRTTRPFADLLILNGPGTVLPLLLSLYLHQILYFDFLSLSFLNKEKRRRRLVTRTIYVESFARVSTLSLTGKIVKGLGMVDRFVTQWPPVVDDDEEEEEDQEEEEEEEEEDKDQAERLSRYWLV